VYIAFQPFSIVVTDLLSLRMQAAARHRECVLTRVQEKEMRTKMDIEENIRDKMLVDEIVRKTIEEDEKFVVFTAACIFS